MAMLITLVPMWQPLDEYGQSALFVAASHGHLALVRRLVALGASPDARAHGGATPACAAAAQGHHEVLAVLAEAGADVQSAGASGLAPADYVMRRALRECRRPAGAALSSQVARCAAGEQRESPVSFVPFVSSS